MLQSVEIQDVGHGVRVEQAAITTDLVAHCLPQFHAERTISNLSEYADAMREGGTFPPVILFRDGDVLRLVDGWHRVTASRDAGLTEIVAEIHDGDLDAATLYAVGANALHGERRTNADKRHAVTMALKQWPNDSDNGIARKCGVGPDLVGTVRRILSENDSIASTAERTFIHHKTGKPAKMKTGAIGKKPAPRAEPASDPVVSLPLPSPPPVPAPAVEPLPEQYEGDDPAAFVVSINLKRRHMTESQRAIVAGRLATMPAHRPGKSANLPTSAMSQPEAAKMLNVSDRSIRTARTVLDKGTPALVKKVEGGEVSVSAAAAIATSPKETQEAIAALPPDAFKVAARVKARQDNNIGTHQSQALQLKS